VWRFVAQKLEGQRFTDVKNFNKMTHKSRLNTAYAITHFTANATRLVEIRMKFEIR